MKQRCAQLAAVVLLHAAEQSLLITTNNYKIDQLITSTCIMLVNVSLLANAGKLLASLCIKIVSRVDNIS